MTSTGHVLDGIETMNSGGYTQVGLTRLNTWCGALVGDVQKAEAYAPVPDEKIQYSWAAAVGQLGQGAAACKDATSTSGNVPAAVTASAATLKSGLTNLKTVLETVDTSAASPAR
ncbi:hypothetical protein [Kitasatospora sp. KL5]|uniref:hypothetical protein n=1 Tax=Kitasatospora sp. KL5 TaxID=3425125 RepID=UPI003D6F3001